MNISCSHCGGRFSITVEQLGKRGKCPHCRATVILPRAKSASSYDADPLVAPSSWSQNTFSGIGAIALHVVLLLLFALVPWGDFNDGTSGQGEQILIGQLPRQTLVDHPEEDFEAMEFENSSDDQSSEELDDELVSPLMTDSALETTLDSQAFSPSSGGSNPLQIDTVHQATMLAGGSEDFGNLLARLQRDGLDIVITFDSTGSMQGEIDQVKDKIERIGKVLFQLVPKTRISICTYRDHGDAYVVKMLPLTDNLAKVVLYLEDIAASGGGDEAEAVEQGLKWSIQKNDFRRPARKVILLFGDAPPRPANLIECQELASEFRKVGGVINTVTCRKDVRMDEFVSIAQMGRGEAFLTQDERQIMTQLIVLVFGSQHREKVMEAFDLLQSDSSR